MEIERKFAVKQVPFDLERYPCVQIAQGYLAEDPQGTQVRLRKAGDQHLLTVKRPSDGGRIEHEFPLAPEYWTNLWELTRGRRIFKTRFNIPHEGFTIEVDVFAGSNEGLIVAEVEFPDVETARTFEPPDWLGEDVTHNPRYSNPRRAVD